MTIEFDTSDFRLWLDKVKRATGGRDPEVHVYSTGWVGRSGDTLQEAIEDQREYGRDPWFLSAHMRNKVGATVLTSIVKPLAAGQNVDLRKALDAIGETMLKAVKANYRNARNKRGRFKPVGEKRSAIKASAGLDPRPMFADGRLYESLRYRIRI